ncbi:hypothetical protein [Oceanirhabdus sp. W0125-5]|uniref:hypothetical protein n=1 Tax=Oceanirhabdus sp. W0125-5 TaxID=2999116 RepID=UPI0022F2FF42|nr:hypothetical protein [Oceanirhabdus sp. W0125-5]WBW95187.1 hypothetical protein OW730_16000 [Oceanirhabdus sp. W0125-5]
MMKFIMYVKESNMMEEVKITAENEEEALYICIDEKLQLIKGIKYVNDLRKELYNEFEKFVNKLETSNRVILCKDVMVKKIP